jgi:hypothetical protein
MRSRRLERLRWAWDRFCFDCRYGVDTTGIVALKELTISSPNEANGVFYEPTPQVFFNAVISSLPIQFNEFVFVDLGSGKGRILLQASSLPFIDVVGVEFSEELHEIAIRNISIYTAKQRAKSEISAILSDVLEYEFPDNNLILYTFNPFDSFVFSKLIQRLKHQVHNKKLIWIYCEAKCHDLLHNSGLVSWRYDVSLPFTLTRRTGWITSLKVYSNFNFYQ